MAKKGSSTNPNYDPEARRAAYLKRLKPRRRRQSSQRNKELFGFDSKTHRGYLRKMTPKRRAEVMLEELSAKNREEALRSGLLPEDFIFDV